MTAKLSVLVAVDFREASARAVRLAGEIAATCGATLTLLHAERADAPPYFTPQQLDELQRQRKAARTQAEAYATAFGREHTQAPFSVMIDDREPVEAILAAARDVDLVIIGTHGRHGFKQWWLGSVAEQVLRRIETALVIVHPDDSTAQGAILMHVPPTLPERVKPMLECARGLTRVARGA